MVYWVKRKSKVTAGSTSYQKRWTGIEGGDEELVKRINSYTQWKT